MISITPATERERVWAAAQVIAHHYLHSAPDPRSRPFCYVVRLASERTPVGCLWFGRPESTRCFAGGLTYGGADDIAAGRAVYDRWELLNLSRVWLSPDAQAGGRLARPELLPGVPGHTDRKGVSRPYVASTVIKLAFARVGFDYLLAEPPVWVDEPYKIRAVLSYCDTKKHRGVIYKAAGMTLARTNEAGVQTWWTPDVGELTAEQDREIRKAAQQSGRCQRKRYAAVSLFDGLEE